MKRERANAKELRAFRDWLGTFGPDGHPNRRGWERAKARVLHLIGIAIGTEDIREHVERTAPKKRAGRGRR